MKRITSTLAAVTCAVMISTTLLAQKMTTTGTGSGGSPHVKAEWTIAGANLMIEYGRPFLKGRPEAQMMPAGQPWRTGADVATILRTDKALHFAAVALAPGAYTINTQPGETWQLILGKLDKEGQWGIPYQPALELGRVPMVVGKTKAPVEQVTIAIDATPAGATLRIEWGTMSVTAPFKVG
jgi:hypothetical protein